MNPNNTKSFTIGENTTLLDALKAIDANKRRFVIVLDDDGHMLGTLTDGDVRRAIISGAALSDKIDCYNRNFMYLTEDDAFTKAIEIFKSNVKFDFIPVLDREGRLKNIVTKGALHTLLLCDIWPDNDYDFLNVDASVLDHEIYERPWGFYKTTVLNDNMQSKVISVRPGERLSLQMHEYREEHWIIVKGEGRAQIGEEIVDAVPGTYLYIPKHTKHRLDNTSGDGTLVLIEVQLGTYFGEDDIIRIEDDYGRQ